MVDMLHKIIYLAILLFVASGYGNNAMAMALEDGGGCAPERKAPSFYAQAEMRTSTSLLPVTEKSNQDSKSDKLQELGEKLKDLTDGLKRLEKEVEKKVLKEIWPRIKQEIERLRKRLREFQLEDSEPEPIEVHLTHTLPSPITLAFTHK